MIRNGDRLLIGVSGGKDSLTLLHTLREIQKSAPFQFEIACATVNPQTPEYDPSPLVDYMAELGVQYHMLSKPIIEMAKEHMNPKRPSICAFCARMKRGMLYTCMRQNGYNVLILGQHLDDLAESFVMSCFHNGALRTMKANYFVQQEDLRVCRPLVYVREKVMAQFAEENQLPIISDNCPACFAAPKERHRVKLLLAREEFGSSELFGNLLKAMKPLMDLKHASIEDDPFVAKVEKVVSQKVMNGRRKQGIVPKSNSKKAGTDASINELVGDEAEDDAAEQVLTKCGLGGGSSCP
jgi:tRNA(Ile)-lysidine synthase TilS/MesJ